MKLVIAGLALIATGAFGAELNTVNVTSGDQADARWKYSVVCVANVEAKVDIKASYRYGEEGKWHEVTMKKNTIWMFTEKLPSDMDADKFTIKFDSDLGEGEELVESALKTQVHTWRQRNCGHTQNYKFLKDRTAESRINIEEVVPQ